MLCAAIDIGSNTTRVLVAEPRQGQLRMVMEQRAYTRVGKADREEGRLVAVKIDEIAEVVATQVRLAEELGAEAMRIVATAAIRASLNGPEVVAKISERSGRSAEILSEHDEGRLAFIGATKSLGHPADGEVAVVDIGGGSSEVIFGTLDGGVREVRSFPVGSGSLADDHISADPPSAAELRSIRDWLGDYFAEVELPRPTQAVAVGGSATSLRRLVGAVLEYETLERGIRVLASEPSAEVAKRFELDPQRVRILPSGVLLLERFADLLGCPLQVGKGGLREGIILDMLHTAGGDDLEPAAAASGAG